MGISKSDLALAATLLDDAAEYLETLYKRHGVTSLEQGIEPDKLRRAAFALKPATISADEPEPARVIDPHLDRW